MDSVIISYTDKKGQQKHEEVVDERVIELSDLYGIELDLTGLNNCRNLIRLNINNNEFESIILPSSDIMQSLRIAFVNTIESIDFSPLSECKSLLHIYLRGNQGIRNFDFSPLSECPALKSITIDSNDNVHHLDFSTLIDSPSLEHIQITYNDGLKSIDLPPTFTIKEIEIYGNNLTEPINLSPVRNNSHLKKFRISERYLTGLDLSPLSECKALEEVLISECREIKKLDLSPLSECISLNSVEISENYNIEDLTLPSPPLLKTILINDMDFLKELDLKPLRYSSQLEYLRIDNLQEIKYIDFYPLANHDNLESLSVSECNKLKEISLSPLPSLRNLSIYQCKNLPIIDVTFLAISKSISTVFTQTIPQVTILAQNSVDRKYPNLTDTVGYYDYLYQYRTINEIKDILSLLIDCEEELWKVKHLLNCLVSAIGLENLGFLDISTQHLELLLMESDISNLRKKCVKHLIKQIDEQGLTIGLDINKMGSEFPEIAVLVPEIIDLREKEIENVTIYRDTETGDFDLRELWLTHFGFEILSAAGYGLRCNKDAFAIIENSMIQLGFNIRIGEGKNVVQISNGSKPFQEYIWKFVSHKLKYDK